MKRPIVSPRLVALFVFAASACKPPPGPSERCAQACQLGGGRMASYDGCSEQCHCVPLAGADGGAP